MKLLVVEDEERIASFLHKGLTAHGYAVEWASTGGEALRLGTGPDIALVILDLKLPDLDGLEVLAKLREQGVTVPVLILSARAQVADRVRGLELGADDYLMKPFAFEELLARVRARMRSRPAAAAGAPPAGDICLGDTHCGLIDDRGEAAFAGEIDRGRLVRRAAAEMRDPVVVANSQRFLSREPAVVVARSVVPSAPCPTLDALTSRTFGHGCQGQS